MGLFVQLRAELVGRGSLREGWLRNVLLGLGSHSVRDRGLSVGPSVVPSLLVTRTPPLRPCREIGLWSLRFATRGMKSLRVEGSWCEGVPGSSRAKSEPKQRSRFRDRFLLGRSSRDCTESLCRRLYLVRLSMPVEDERCSIHVSNRGTSLVLRTTVQLEQYLGEVLSVS